MRKLEVTEIEKAFKALGLSVINARYVYVTAELQARACNSWYELCEMEHIKACKDSIKKPFLFHVEVKTRNWYDAPSEDFSEMFIELVSIDIEEEK